MDVDDGGAYDSYEYEESAGEDEDEPASSAAAPAAAAAAAAGAPAAAAARLSFGASRVCASNPAFLLHTHETVGGLIEDVVHELCDLLHIHEDEVFLLLVHCGWSASKLKDAWFNDADALRRAAGVPEPVDREALLDPARTTLPVDAAGCVADAVLMEDVPLADCDVCPAGHAFSSAAWAAALGAALETPLGVLTAACLAAPDCGALVPPAMWRRRCTPEQLARYAAARATAFVDVSRSLAFCPAADCTSA